MHALISGASVAGPVLAYWLRRHGWRVTVVERAADARAGDGGHAVDLFGPAVDVIERMGLLDRVREARTRNDTITLFRDGRAPITLATADLAAGVPGRHIEIMRGVLAGLLHEVTRDDVDYRFGTVIERLDGATAVLSDGDIVDADLVVGADGLHSGVRALAFGPEERYRRFLGAHLAVYTLPDVLGTGPTVAAFTAPGLAATVYPTLVPGLSRALFLVRTAEIPHDRHDRDAQKEILRDLIRDRLGPRVAAVLEHLGPAGDFYFDDISQIRMDSWSRGPVTLVGDAGYGPGPAVGGGTSLAAAAAYVLAAELATGPVDGALRRYEAALAGPVRHSRRIGPSVLGAIVPRNRAQVWLTAQATRLLPRLPGPARRWLTSFGGGPAAMLDGLVLPPMGATRS
ncbi:2-polyprenyl-6-methoxyphenol hydroxylase-like FAD-dependent oxidoreductase [Actinoplanes campanulatus]|uniref:2-polyprenyl-6-methoxyphenol hydroxylase-like FAD-dependent oxidoreductase n=1 Tax=Actinoplanes campanulatus TaxID=113559 RepID=A0A7W5ACZ6_9ACTN|nr:FAD-dependent monooxygenase [Actinoplanes campanulatus]MBB3094018.1 2-polyprenyl-6-methoxyphenol hydroxylase-like FAD-dependent oxidoreductase [Actinoplanes campanulatus]GGN33257.1 FAD-dependent oxidoreductase [Actinoplanes campanulatus]GID38286.1 FAD-dependent oxidoreductase [Actinoplanes campanulatus]